MNVVAHQGGWDEILLVALPIALFAVLLVLANKRAARELARQAPQDPAGPEGGEPGDAPPGWDSSGSDVPGEPSARPDRRRE